MNCLVVFAFLVWDVPDFAIWECCMVCCMVCKYSGWMAASKSYVIKWRIIMWWSFLPFNLENTMHCIMVWCCPCNTSWLHVRWNPIVFLPFPCPKAKACLWSLGRMDACIVWAYRAAVLCQWHDPESADWWVEQEGFSEIHVVGVKTVLHVWLV